MRVEQVLNVARLLYDREGRLRHSYLLVSAEAGELGLKTDKFCSGTKVASASLVPRVR